MDRCHVSMVRYQGTLGEQVAEIGDVMCSSWLCVRRQAADWESCQDAATSFARGTPCYLLRVLSNPGTWQTLNRDCYRELSKTADRDCFTAQFEKNREAQARIQPGKRPSRGPGHLTSERRRCEVGTDFADGPGYPTRPEARQCNRSRSLHVNGLLVYRKADREMVDRAGDRPVYSVDYFISAVTLLYLTALREEIEIPNYMELIVPGPNDLPSRSPLG
ncbi:hypothetical protein TIFTF001_017392 [Ficus carica]|uniref:Uncharacterized protein n=1 Tax=Ficus carica TaxID=3494 RepID=A0AA88D9M1_FICCA|nr:hypothetical protein TIFTF001_017392 [Ficus carica]